MIGVNLITTEASRMAKILVVDDELPLIQVLSYNLKQSGYEVLVARDGEEALLQARRHLPDLVILDLMLPKIDGLEVCRRMRRERDVPIIMLTARDDEIDRVVGLELGADDYVVKPFSVRELLARVRNVLRRFQPAEPAETVTVAGLTIDTASHTVQVGSAQMAVTSLEFALLLALGRNAGRVLSRDQLIEAVWGYDYHGDGRVVDAVIKRLRSKLREAGTESDIIVTVRGLGYRIDHVH
jgi:DNA-binding response OmpR family regulator